MSEMYDRIQALCAQHGVNVTEMCEALGISRSSLSELKAGRTRELTFKTLLPIAEYFGTTTDYLAGKQHPEPATPDPELAEVLELYRSNAGFRLLYDLARDADEAAVIEAAQIMARNKKKMEP